MHNVYFEQKLRVHAFVGVKLVCLTYMEENMKKLLRYVLAVVAAGNLVSAAFADSSKTVKKALSAKAIKNQH